MTDVQIASEVRQRFLVVLGGLVAIFLAALDQTIIVTILEDVSKDFALSGDAHLLVVAYLTSAAPAALILGRFSDQLGRRIVIATAWMCFLFGSLIAISSTSFPMLIAARFLQGIGAGGMVSLSNAAIADVFPPSKIGKISGLMGVIHTAASILGPSLGMLLVRLEGWRLVFWINLPMVAISLFCLMLSVDKNNDSGAWRKIDAVGSIALFVFCTTLIFFIKEGFPQGGYDYALAALLFVSLLIILMRKGLFDKVLLSSDNVPWILLATIFGIGTYLCMVVLVPIVWFNEQIFDHVDFVKILTGMMCATAFSATLTGRHIFKSGNYKSVMVMGMSVSFSTLFLATFFVPPGVAGVQFAIFVLCGLGIGPSFPSLAVAMQNSSEKQFIGTAMGYLHFSRSLGGAMLVAIVADLAGVYDAPPSSSVTHTYTSSIFGWIALCNLAALLCCLLIKSRSLRDS